MDWTEFFASFSRGFIIGIIVYFSYSIKTKIMYLEERIIKLEERIKNQNNTVHKHRDFLEIEISRIYDKLENHNKHREFFEIEISRIYDKLENHNGEL